MSLRLDGVGDYAERTGAANLGNNASGTLVGWWRKEDSTLDREILSLSKSGGGGVFRVQSATQIKGGFIGGALTNVAMALNSWAGLAIVYNASTSDWILYFYQAGILTTVATENIYNSNPIATVRVGNNDIWADSAVGSNRYLRFWNRAQSAAEIQAEFETTPSVGIPAASTVGLFDSWLLPDGTDGIGVFASTALTISGAVTSTEEPTIGGGGASVFIPTQYRRTNALLRM